MAGAWNKMGFKVPSHPNHCRILLHDEHLLWQQCRACSISCSTITLPSVTALGMRFYFKKFLDVVNKMFVQPQLRVHLRGSLEGGGEGRGGAAQTVGRGRGASANQELGSGCSVIGQPRLS